MKREVNNGIAMYLITLLIMPIITMAGLLMLQEEMLKATQILNLSINDITRVFTGEIILFLVIWVSLFVSYLLHLFGVKGAQIVLAVYAFAFLILNVTTAVNDYASIAHIINPVLLFITSGYSVMKPLDVKVTEKRKERVKNSIKKASSKNKKDSKNLKKKD